MELLVKHLNEHLSDFTNNNANALLFDKVFNALKSSLKETQKNHLKYLFRILEHRNEENDNEFIPLNIHFEKKLTDNEKTLIAEFLWHYYFELQHFNDNTGETNIVLENRIANLIKSTSQEINLPYIDPMATKDEKKRNKAQSE